VSPLAPLPDPELRPAGTALLVVDMQYFDAHREYGMALLAAPGETDEYFEQVDEILPRIRRLQDLARAHGIAVVHTHLCSRAPGGADMCRSHRLRGWRYAAGTKEAEFLPEVAPLPGELVVEKTSSGAFNSGGLEQALRNLGITRIVICGVDTRFCVETTVRDASDRGFEVVLVGDACASKTRELHEQGLAVLHNSYCCVWTAGRVAAEIEATRRRRRSAPR
jgi:nicotinamidase-related amidase